MGARLTLTGKKLLEANEIGQGRRRRQSLPAEDIARAFALPDNDDDTSRLDRVPLSHGLTDQSLNFGHQFILGERLDDVADAFGWSGP